MTWGSPIWNLGRWYLNHQVTMVLARLARSPWLDCWWYHSESLPLLIIFWFRVPHGTAGESPAIFGVVIAIREGGQGLLHRGHWELTLGALGWAMVGFCWATPMNIAASTMLHFGRMKRDETSHFPWFFWYFGVDEPTFAGRIWPHKDAASKHIQSSGALIETFGGSFHGAAVQMFHYPLVN